MTEQEVLQKLTALCSQAEHCTGEMREKMQKWEVGDDVQERVVAYLIREKYVDDARFTRCFAMDKIRFSGWGRRKIEQALWMKHVESAVSRPVLDDIDEEEYMQVLRPLLLSKRKSVKGASEYERNMKLMRFAMGRGFTFDQIRQCIDCEEEE